MSGPSQSRRRGVRLKVEAIAALESALLKRWQEDPSRRLTREWRADVLGVSIPTVDKALKGNEVDRATLILMFESAGLAWDNAFCEPNSSSAAPELESATDRQSVAPMVPAPQQKKLGWAMLASAAALVTFGTIWAIATPTPKPAWDAEFEIVMSRATQAFHSGDYPTARLNGTRALILAEKSDGGGRLAEAVRLAGDLATERGEFVEAKTHYLRALELRSVLRQDATRPPILEALGVVQTKLGNYDEALQTLNLARNGFQSFGDKVGVAMTLRDLGSMWFARGQVSKASQCFKDSLFSIRGELKPDLVADVAARQALVLNERGRPAEARVVLKKCLGHWVTKAHPRWIAKTHLQLGLVEYSAGNPELAKEHLARAVAGFQNVGDHVGSRAARQVITSGCSQTRKPHPLTGWAPD